MACRLSPRRIRRGAEVRVSTPDSSASGASNPRSRRPIRGSDLLSDAQVKHQPPSDKGKRLKIYYMTQPTVAPPSFVIFCNSEELFHFSYQRYIENCIRETFGFVGTPIRIIVRERGEDKK